MQARGEPEPEFCGKAARSLEGRSPDLVAIDKALVALAGKHEVIARYVDLRVFGGCTNEQAARELSMSGRTGERLWSFARSWLQRRMRG